MSSRHLSANKKKMHVRIFDLFHPPSRPAAEHQLLWIPAPESYFERAKIFFDDVRYMKGSDYENLKINFLLFFLFDGLLDHVRRGVHLTSYMIRLVNTYSHILEPSDEPEQAAKPDRLWSLFSPPQTHTSNRICKIKLELPARDVHRVQFFLTEQKQRNSYIELTVEELIALLFIEFISNLKENDSAEEYQHFVDALVNRLEDYL